MSLIRDRVKQTATVTSNGSGIHVLTLDAGSAPDGFRTFRDGYNIPNVATLGANVSAFMPIVIEFGSAWISGVARYQRDNTGTDGVTTLTIDINADGVQHQGIGGGIPVSSVVTVYVAPVASQLGAIHVDFDLSSTEPNSGNDGDPVYYDGPIGASTGGNPGTLKGAVAIGDGARARSSRGVAIGRLANTSGMFAVAIGDEAGAAMPYASVIGKRSGSWYPASFEHDHNNVGITAGFVATSWQGNAVCFMQQKTTNATPTDLNVYQPGATDSLLPGTGWEELYIEPGVTYVEAMVTAYNTATEEAKVWTLKFAVRNIFAYGGIAFLGSVVKTVVGSDANTASWDINPILGADFFTFRATGEAAKNIVWACTFNAKMHILYN